MGWIEVTTGDQKSKFVEIQNTGNTRTMDVDELIRQLTHKLNCKAFIYEHTDYEISLSVKDGEDGSINLLRANARALVGELDAENTVDILCQKVKDYMIAQGKDFKAKIADGVVCDVSVLPDMIESFELYVTSALDLIGLTVDESQIEADCILITVTQ